MDPVDTGQLEEVLAVLRGVLGGDLVAAYLYGSATLGGLKPASDLDVFAVSARATSPGQRQALVAGLLPLSGRPGGVPRPVEVTIVAQPDVKPWRYPPVMDFLFGEWLRAAFLRGEIEPPRPNADLATLVAMVRLTGRALAGAQPAEVLEPVPARDLRRANVDTIPSLLADLEPDTRNVLLTLARIWTTLATGEIRAKDAAAEWALERLPDVYRPPLALARDQYRGDAEWRGWAAEAAAWREAMPAARALADRLTAEIARVEAGSDGAEGRRR